MKIILVFLLIIPGICLGQNPGKELFVQNLKLSSTDSRIEVNANGDTVLISYFLENNNKVNTNSVKEFIYKGTPYFKNGWYNGTVILEPGGKKSNGFLGYNINQNKLFVSFSSSAQAIQITPYEFEIGGHIFRKYDKVYAAAGNFYYEKLTEGYFELFKQYKCVYYPKITGDRSGYEVSGDGFEGEFVKKTDFFINWNGKMQVLGNSFRYFEPFQVEAKRFASDNELSLKKENDLFKIVNYLNELAKKTPPDKL